MKTTLKLVLGTLLIWGFTSCEDETIVERPYNSSPVVVQFAQPQATISENAGTQEVSVSLSKQAGTAGTVTIHVITSKADAFTTEPAAVNGLIELPVAQGAGLVSLQVTPVNNAVIDGDKSVSFVINSTSEGFVKGGQVSTDLLITDDEGPVASNFSQATITLSETQAEGIAATIVLSAASMGEGSLEIQIQPDGLVYGQHFTTNPAASNNKVILPVATGTTEVSFTILPVNNTVVTGHKTLVFTIASAVGAVNKGTALTLEVNLIDDELVAKPKSYETIAGDKVKRTFEYDEFGRLYKEHWETHTPFQRSSTFTYFYDNLGRLERKNEYPNIDVVYLWQGGRIVKSQKVNHGEVKEYAEYFYDDHGNIAATAYYFRQSSGEYKLTTVIDFLYFTDGNLYKSFLSVPTESGEFVTLSTKTYDGYVNGQNPFPMVELLPTVKTMHKLPTFYQVEENGFTFTYQISYKLREDGLPVKRTAQSSAGNQITTYEYY